MGWNSNTGIMTAPLNINTGGDIQQAVNYNSGDLGDCIVNGTINKWAKWKPQRSSKIGPLTLAERQATFFGFKLTKYTDMSTFEAGYAEEWSYLRPRGLTTYNERFRFYDFLNTTVSSSGYNKNAACFFRQSASTFPKEYVIGSGGLSYIAQWEPESQLDSYYPGSVKPSDIKTDPNNNLSPTIGDCYFGILMNHSYWSSPKIKTASTYVTQSGYTYTSTVTFSDSELQNFPSGVTVYPILSIDPISTISTDIPRSGIYALPGAVGSSASSSTIDVKPATTMYQIIVRQATAAFVAARLNVSVTVGLYSTVADTIGRLNINVYQASSMEDKTGEQIGSTENIDGVTTTQDQTWEQNYRITRPDYIRVVIIGSPSQGTQIISDFNLAVSWEAI